MVNYATIHVSFSVPAEYAEMAKADVESQFSTFLENELTYECRVPEGLCSDADAEYDFNCRGNDIKVSVEI